MTYLRGYFLTIDKFGRGCTLVGYRTFDTEDPNHEEGRDLMVRNLRIRNHLLVTNRAPVLGANVDGRSNPNSFVVNTADAGRIG